jgi:hypothetical protein
LLTKREPDASKEVISFTVFQGAAQVADFQPDTFASAKGLHASNIQG